MNIIIISNSSCDGNFFSQYLEACKYMFCSSGLLYRVSRCTQSAIHVENSLRDYSAHLIFMGFQWKTSIGLVRRSIKYHVFTRVVVIFILALWS